MFTPNRSPGSRRWISIRAANPLAGDRGDIVGAAFWRRHPGVTRTVANTAMFFGTVRGSAGLANRSPRGEVSGALASPARFGTLPSPQLRYV
jgi:hypothetical protein